MFMVIIVLFCFFLLSTYLLIAHVSAMGNTEKA